MRAPKPPEMAIVAASAALLLLLFLGKAFHIDEPCFLGWAKQVLRDPLRPTSFMVYWDWEMRLASRYTPYLSLVPYYLAPAVCLWGDSETALRLFSLPVDILAATALYGLASEFLAYPLVPTLIVLASPGYLLNMQLLVGEKWMGAAGFLGLYCLVAALRRRRAALLAASALLLSTSVLFKPNGALFILVALAYCLLSRMRRRPLLTFGALAVLPAAAVLACSYRAGIWNLAWLAGLHRSRANYPWLGWAHRLRSLFTGLGACGVVVSFWPFLGWRGKPPPRTLAVALLSAAVIFLPAFDWYGVSPAERAAGVLISWPAILGLTRILALDRGVIRGRELWVPWLALSLCAEVLLHGYITTRALAFMIPPAVFALASCLEACWDPAALRALYGWSLAATSVLGLSLAAVDMRFAGAQREFARMMASEYIARGRKVWYSGHWGFEYYLAKAGASPLILSSGGWAEARPGDVVAVPKHNTTVMPAPRILANARVIEVDCPIPLRLLPSQTAHAGFYNNAGGFLPYVLSREPVEEFTVVERL